MLDPAVAYNRYKFLGYEFLTWLWFFVDNDQEQTFLAIGNRIVLENSQREAVETITIKGDDAGLEEGILALRKGAVVTELNLSYKAGNQEWHFTIKGESLTLASLKPPDTGAIENRQDLEGAVLEKAYLYNEAIQVVDDLFKKFIKLRVSDHWNRNVVPLVRQWIYS